jgi:hypothetical protein
MITVKSMVTTEFAMFEVLATTTFVAAPKEITRLSALGTA